MSELIRIFFDGGSRGNPGPASGAAYSPDKGGISLSIFLPHASNNEAEYHGLLLAIRIAKEHGFQNVRFLGDSKLVVCQVTGEWKVKSEALSELHAQAVAQLKSLPRWRIDWIPREENSEADRVANQAMDDAMGIVHFEDEDEIENPPKRDDIIALNLLGSKADFKALRSLKVGGMDEYSKASPEVLKTLISRYEAYFPQFVARVKATPSAKDLAPKDQEKLAINALRWVARGLKKELAIKKILMDHETAIMMKDKRR